MTVWLHIYLKITNEINESALLFKDIDTSINILVNDIILKIIILIWTGQKRGYVRSSL
jgi:hypothetical protein